MRFTLWREVRFVFLPHSSENYQGKALGPKNQRHPVVHWTPFHETVHMTFLTDPSNTGRPFYYEFHDHTNTGGDFASFTRNCIEKGFLKQGDVYIMDNARVHFSSATAASLMADLERIPVRQFPDYLTLQVSPVRLPTYSPELNPCELCFSLIRCWMQRNRDISNRLQDIVERAIIETVTQQKILNFYEHCLRYRPDSM